MRSLNTLPLCSSALLCQVIPVQMIKFQCFKLESVKPCMRMVRAYFWSRIPQELYFMPHLRRMWVLGCSPGESQKLWRLECMSSVWTDGSCYSDRGPGCQCYIGQCEATCDSNLNLILFSGFFKHLHTFTLHTGTQAHMYAHVHIK